MRPRAAWKHVFEPLIRRSAGLGAAPTVRRRRRLRSQLCPCRRAGGRRRRRRPRRGAGRRRSRRAGAADRAGRRTGAGGRWSTAAAIDGEPVDAWVASTLAALDAMPNVARRAGTTAAGVYDHGYVLAEERPATGPRRRLWRIRARRVVAATGAIERPLAFAGNDLPGVMLAGAVRDYLALWGVAPGERSVVVTANDDGYRTALALHAAGLAVPAVLDARAWPEGALPRAARAAGIRVVDGAGIAGVTRPRPRRRRQDLRPGRRPARCARRSPATSSRWPAAGRRRCTSSPTPAAGSPGTPRPRTSPPIRTARRATAMAAASCCRPARRRGRSTRPPASRMRTPPGAAPRPRWAAPRRRPGAVAAAEDAAPSEPVWMMPQRAGPALRAKAFLDFQNDVKVSDVELAAREGYASVEHAKRYTTLGMATDQGKLSNINGLAVLAGALGRPIPEVGTTTFRPPYTPVTFGAIAGEARGALFKPVRRTPMDAWHAANGADWEPVGDWRRPYCYLRPGETVPQAVTREILNTRAAVGMLDASTLGKLAGQGPRRRPLPRPRLHRRDVLAAGRPLPLRADVQRERLPVRRRRGGAAEPRTASSATPPPAAPTGCTPGWRSGCRPSGRIFSVYVANLTEQFAQFAVVGPKARAVLEAIGGDIDLSREALPFMHWAEGTLGGLPARVYRISFSGELSYEVAVPASQGQALWDALLGGGRWLRHRALRHRGAARDARREGLHHDRRRDRRHGDAAGSRPRLGGVEEEARLHRQAGAGAPRPDPAGPQAAGRAADRGSRGGAARRRPRRRRPGAGGGPDADARPRHLQLLLAHARPLDRDGARRPVARTAHRARC